MHIRSIIKFSFFSVLIISTGIVGYMLIEGWDLVDAAYMTAITLSTVGFMEVHKTGDSGKLFTILLIFTGGGYYLYLVSAISKFIVEGEIKNLLGRQRLDKKINKLNHHYIVCGYGRIGRVLGGLIKEETPDLVIVESNAEREEELQEGAFHYIIGDASDEDILVKAGIERADFLVACLGTDAANVFLVLTARQLHPDIYILARADNPSVRKKLLVAGANRVEAPYDIGAETMAMKLLRPSVQSFLDTALSRKNEDIQIEELFVPVSSQYTNVALKDSGIRQDFNLIIISIKKKSGQMLFNPHFETLIEPLDTVIVVGKRADLKRFEIALNPES